MREPNGNKGQFISIAEKNDNNKKKRVKKKKINKTNHWKFLWVESTTQKQFNSQSNQISHRSYRQIFHHNHKMVNSHMTLRQNKTSEPKPTTTTETKKKNYG